MGHCCFLSLCVFLSRRRNKEEGGEAERKTKKAIPEQLRQTKTPRLTLAHVGPLPPHSAQRRLASSFKRAARARRWASAWARVTEDLSAIACGELECEVVEVEEGGEIDGRDGAKKEGKKRTKHAAVSLSGGLALAFRSGKG